MKTFFASLIILTIISSISCENENADSVEKIFVCYYGTWSTYRHGSGKFDVDNIDPYLCTHIVYSFVGILTSGHIRVIDPYLDLEEFWGRANIKKFNKLKLQNPKLKTLVAIGGWNEKSKNFSIVANDPLLRQTFAEDAVKFVKKYDFDGFDIDWEYPAQRNGDAENDKNAFTELVKVLRKLFDENDLLLTAAVACAEFSASVSYDIPKMSQYLDFINVMTYDLHGPWDSLTGLNSPLYADHKFDITDLEKQMNVNASIHYWISQGVPCNKLILGIPLYGRTYQLKNKLENHLGAEHMGAGQAGIYTNEPGMIGYNEFCELQMKSEWTRVWCKKQLVPYAFKDDQWVTFDDLESVSIKVKYINDYNLGGAMVWSIETDDFRGVCGKGKNPMLTNINEMLNLPKIPRSMATSNHDSPVPLTGFVDRNNQSLEEKNNNDNNIPDAFCKDGFMESNPNDCSSYYVCWGGEKITKHCPADLFFDAKSWACNWRHLVKCEANETQII